MHYQCVIYGVTIRNKQKTPRPAGTPQEGNAYVMNKTSRVFSPDRSGILLLLQKIERRAGLNVLRKLNGVLLKFKKG
jgi:hypothetical protein